MRKQPISAKPEKHPYLYGGVIIFLVWLLLHVFTISWELPHTMPPETDGISPDTSLNARAMMAKETFKYPPLQYLTVDWLTPRIAEKGMTSAQILEHRSARLETMRWITASQELLTAFLVLFFALRILLLPLLPSLCAALSFLLLPLSLFYSQTTNMDMPCAFWFFASITCAVYAEYFAERKKIYLPLSLMTGILIGCAFCTKDQLYAAYLLPAAAFAVWKLRRHKQVLPALMPFFPWLAGFLISTASIYLLIGKETFLPHFKWITGSGSDASYAMVSDTVSGHCRLFLLQFQDIGTALDWSLLLFFLLSILLLIRKPSALKENKTILPLSVFTLLTVFSIHLFFCQVVRYTYPRYLVPVLPFFCLLAALLWHQGFSRKAVRYTFPALLPVQCAIAVQFLYGLNHTPRTQLVRLIENDRDSLSQIRMNTVSAAVGARYILHKDGSMHPKKKIQPWGAQLGLNRFGIYDIMPDDISIFMVAPALLVSESPGKKLEDSGFQLRQMFRLPPPLIPTLYRHDAHPLFLYAAAPRPTADDPLADFRKEPLEMQMIKLAYLVSRKPPLSNQKLAEIGRALAAFHAPDTEHYDLPYFVHLFLHFAYHAAGRGKDAETLRNYLRQAFPQESPPPQLK